VNAPGQEPPLPGDTLVEDSVAPSPGGVWLIDVGSPEDGFATAGTVLPLEWGTVVLFGRATGTGFELRRDDGTLHIGLPYAWVSTTHAELTCPASSRMAFSLRDLGSRNGTLLRAQRISGTATVTSGQCFEIGRSFWCIRHVEGNLKPLATPTLLDAAVSCNPELQRLHRNLGRLAPSLIPIVLRGETGTGKEYLARAVHRSSGRPGPFVVAHLTAISEARLQARLFGAPGEDGLFEEARGGTLLLDEPGELSLSAQASLRTSLAAMLDSSDPPPVRIIVASARDLAAMVERGTFRADLYARLAGFVGEIPALRARREDLGLLCRGAIGDLERRGGQATMTTNAFRRIMTRQWPFNVRRLVQAIGSAYLLTTGGAIVSDAISEALEQDDALPTDPEQLVNLRSDLVAQLAAHHGDVDGVGRALGQSPAALGRWLERFALDPRRFEA